MKTCLPFNLSRLALLYPALLLLITACSDSRIPAEALATAESVQFIEVGFFEGHVEADPPEWESTDIKTSFQQDDARYIYTLVNLKNRLWNVQGQDVKINLRYYRSDGRLFGEPDIDYHVPADWEYADLWAGWGWDRRSEWEPDTYRVELWLNGDKKIGEGLFKVTTESESFSVASKTEVEFDQIGFFEAGDDAGSSIPVDWNDERLQHRFAHDATRFVYTMVSVKNLHWNVQDQNVKINLRYYRSNGELFGDPVIDYRIPMDWEFAELWNGWGWPEAGNWDPDRYRVELWLDNRNKIGESYFTIE